MMNNLIQIAKNWLNQDPDQETRDELRALIEANDLDTLSRRFSGRLQFGTAGFRGSLQAVLWV